MPEPVLTLNEVASLTKLSRRSLNLRIARGTGPTVLRMGHKTVRVRVADVEAWLASMAVPAGVERRAA